MPPSVRCPRSPPRMRPATLSSTARSPALGLTTSLYGDQYRRVLVLEEEDHELGRLCLARVAPDGVNVRRSLVERLTRGERHGLATLDAHHDGAFEHVDQRVRVVLVDRVGAAWRVVHRDHEQFLPR